MKPLSSKFTIVILVKIIFFDHLLIAAPLKSHQIDTTMFSIKQNNYDLEKKIKHTNFKKPVFNKEGNYHSLFKIEPLSKKPKPESVLTKLPLGEEFNKKNIQIFVNSIFPKKAINFDIQLVQYTPQQEQALLELGAADLNCGQCQYAALYATEFAPAGAGPPVIAEFYLEGKKVFLADPFNAPKLEGTPSRSILENIQKTVPDPFRPEKFVPNPNQSPTLATRPDSAVENISNINQQPPNNISQTAPSNSGFDTQLEPHNLDNPEFKSVLEDSKAGDLTSQPSSPTEQTAVNNTTAQADRGHSVLEREPSTTANTSDSQLPSSESSGTNTSNSQTIADDRSVSELRSEAQYNRDAGKIHEQDLVKNDAESVKFDKNDAELAKDSGIDTKYNEGDQLTPEEYKKFREDAAKGYDQKADQKLEDQKLQEQNTSEEEEKKTKEEIRKNAVDEDSSPVTEQTGPNSQGAKEGQEGDGTKGKSKSPKNWSESEGESDKQ